MTARQFKTALDELGWSEEEAAAQLEAWVATPHLVSEWRHGKRPVPKRVATHVRAALSLRLWVQSYVGHPYGRGHFPKEGLILP